jgi:subtilisin
MQKTHTEPAAIIDREAILQALKQGTGRGVRLGLLDTGVDEAHEDLKGKLAGHYELVERGVNMTFVEATGTDLVGHGTACAGIILSLAPEVELHSVKVIGANAKGSSAGLVAGLRWCNENAMHVINASLGTIERRSREAISDAVDEAVLGGITVVAAANNGGYDAWPAHLTSVISVDNEAIEDPLEFRYRAGSPVELEARGIYVEAPSPGGGTKFYTGTSFACPHASAIVARLLSVYPGLQPFEVRSLLWRLGRQEQERS